MTVEDLIKEMQATKAAHPTLSLSEILRIFNIKAMRDLTEQLKRVANK